MTVDDPEQLKVYKYTRIRFLWKLVKIVVAPKRQRDEFTIATKRQLRSWWRYSSKPGLVKFGAAVTAIWLVIKISSFRWGQVLSRLPTNDVNEKMKDDFYLNEQFEKQRRAVETSRMMQSNNYAARNDAER